MIFFGFSVETGFFWKGRLKKLHSSDAKTTMQLIGKAINSNVRVPRFWMSVKVGVRTNSNCVMSKRQDKLTNASGNSRYAENVLCKFVFLLSPQVDPLQFAIAIKILSSRVQHPKVIPNQKGVFGPLDGDFFVIEEL